jgi:hypothetical protein
MDKEKTPSGLQRTLLPLLVFGLVAVVYARTMAPTVFGLDSAELSLGALKLGIVHAPGYPVYLMLAHLFTRIPIGDIGFRVNLFSVICGAAMVASLPLLLEMLIADRKHAFSAALAFAFIYYQWTVSLAAEVYAFQGLLFTWILILSLRWRRQGNTRTLFSCLFVCSLAAANNPATLLWWPGLFYILFAHGGFAPATGDVLKAFGFLILGLLPVLYLPVRSAANPGFVYVGEYDLQAVFHPLDLTKPANLLWYLSGGQFKWLFPAIGLREWLEQGLTVLQQFWYAYLGVGVPLGVWGVIRLKKIDSRYATGLVSIAIPFLIFFTGYQAPDKEFMLLPLYILWTIPLGLGIEALTRGVRRWTSWLGYLLPLALLIVNFRYVDASDARLLSTIGRTRLSSVEPGSFYLATWGDASIMQYLQEVENLRMDVKVINVFFVGEDDLPILVKKALNSHYNVYLSRRDIFPDSFGVLDPVGHGYRVQLREQ